MTRREWVAAVWAEWAPSYRAGRIDVGPLVITVTTRKQIQRDTWEHMLIGVTTEKKRPGVVAEMVAELSGDKPSGATVHRLHAVQG